MKRHHFLEKLDFIKSDLALLRKRPHIMILIALALPAIYFIVYSTGGIKYVYSHSMYIPIILAGIYFGVTFGVLIALIAGILLGPLMPIDSLTGEMQDPLNWLYRLMIFILVGLIIGYASNKLRKDAKQIRNLMSVNQETKIPNTNFLKDIQIKFHIQTHSIYTILIGNHHSIIDLLGVGIYHKFIYKIYTDLIKKLPEKTIVIQSDSNKLWVLVPNDLLKENVELIIDILNEPKQINNIPMYADISIGGSLSYRNDEFNDLSIFENSDISARYAQLNNIPYALGDLDKYQKKSEYELLATFSQALQDHQTYLVYQPKIDLKTLKPMGLEALIRWNHPIKGNIPPDQFIPLIEETKLIHQLTDWVLTHALRKCQEIMKTGCKIPVSINISGKNLYDPHFYDRTIQIIQNSSVPYELIEFELTESVLMINPQQSKEILERFVALGIKISIDDFGSGYSSLAYLTKFPIHYIKIDRFFMKNITQDYSMSEIVKSTVALSKNLGYQVVVEGVETKEVVDLLQSYDCDIAQGYFFAKPMKSNDLAAWFEDCHRKHDKD